MDDSWPVYKELYYICDGRVMKSPINGTVRDLKYALQVRNVTRCTQEALNASERIRKDYTSSDWNRSYNL